MAWPRIQRPRPRPRRAALASLRARLWDGAPLLTTGDIMCSCVLGNRSERSRSHADRGTWDLTWARTGCSVDGLDYAEALVVLRCRMRWGRSHQTCSQAGAVCRRDGGVLRGTSSWPRSASAGPRGAADVPGVCPPLRQIAEERRSRCGSDRRGGNETDDAVRQLEEHGAA